MDHKTGFPILGNIFELYEVDQYAHCATTYVAADPLIV